MTDSRRTRLEDIVKKLKAVGEDLGGIAKHEVEDLQRVWYKNIIEEFEELRRRISVLEAKVEELRRNE